MKDTKRTFNMQSKKIKTEFTGKKITKYAGLSSFMPFILTKLNLF